MASEEQKELMVRFYNHTGWEFMGKDEVRSNKHREFSQMWNRNIQWIEDVTNEASHFIDEYRLKYTHQIYK